MIIFNRSQLHNESFTSLVSGLSESNLNKHNTLSTKKKEKIRRKSLTKIGRRRKSLTKSNKKFLKSIGLKIKK